MLPLQRLQLAKQHIVLCIGNFRLIEFVILTVVMNNPLAKFGQALLYFRVLAIAHYKFQSDRPLRVSQCFLTKRVLLNVFMQMLNSLLG